MYYEKPLNFGFDNSAEKIAIRIYLTLLKVVDAIPW